ncbi:unnamed protein product [Brassicogethes aeneus]|uniref:Malate dehydrogenase n=1 Tax=Brassicogethes aeneus TaxID=1431903 RepID=A0A9P0AY03_BRAAE|nr:unnamed protein product [Brassicogethes aeneus]
MASRTLLRNVASTNQHYFHLSLHTKSISNSKYIYSQKAKMSSSESATHELTTQIEEARRFMIDCFRAVGTPQDNAEIVADNLIEADHRGHYSHGMNRLEMYINDIQGGECDPTVKPTVIKESVATAFCNGNNGLGAVVGKMCMDIAIAKASTAGIGISALGTNPISLGAPANCGDSFVLDMATTAVAVGKIELAKRKGTKLPSGWAINNEGNIESDPAIAYDARKLMPLGGAEETSGYKGYGLGALVEVLCGILGGSAFGPNIRKWGEHGKPANLGNCFIAINPNNFADGFEDRMSSLLNHLRSMEPADPSKPVLVAGDPEIIHMEKVKIDGGLRYVKNQHDTNSKLATKLGVKPMKTLFDKQCDDKKNDEDKTPIFKVSEVERFVRDCCLKSGCSDDNANDMGKLLIMADRMGIKTHGLNRLEMYLGEVSSGMCDGQAKPSILKETPATALIDGHNGLGHIIGKFAMEVAIKKCREEGVGMTSCFDGNHYGVAGVYTLQAIDCGYIGFSFTNTSPLVVPHGAKERALGTNPFTIGGPAGCSDRFNVDVSSSGVAVGKVEVKKKLGQPVPVGWAINPDGSPATDPDSIIKDTRLLALGSPEFGQKGYGLGIMVDMFTGILSGALNGPFIKPFKSTERKSNLGYTFIAINPDMFAPDFQKRFEDYLKYIRCMPPIDPKFPVMVAGDMESNAMKETDLSGHLDYNPAQIQICQNLAKKLGVAPMKPSGYKD